MLFQLSLSIFLYNFSSLNKKKIIICNSPSNRVLAMVTNLTHTSRYYSAKLCVNTSGLPHTWSGGTATSWDR